MPSRVKHLSPQHSPKSSGFTGSCMSAESEGVGPRRQAEVRLYQHRETLSQRPTAPRKRALGSGLGGRVEGYVEAPVDYVGRPMDNNHVKALS
jgi:hypothetical protein